MSIIDASILLIAALFGLYGLASALEYGIVFKMLQKDETSKKMFTPLWEVTNVFLVFGFTGLTILFNGALSRLSHDLLATIALAIVVMLLRACVVLGIFYIKSNDKIATWLLWLFAAATFLVPLIFSSAGVYLLSGQLFWHSLLGWVLMLATVSGLTSVGLLIINRQAKARQQLPGNLAFAFWLLVLGCILPLIVLHTSNSLASGPLLGLVAIAAGGLGLMLVGFVKKIVLSPWSFGAGAAILVPVILAWAARPYLIAGKLTLKEAFGAQTYASVVVVGLAILTPLILVGFFVFAKLLGFDPLNQPASKQ